MKQVKRGPAVLLILDGWGIGPHDESNAIWRAKTPHYNQYIAEYGCSELEAASVHVGLPQGQDGNSEAGHMNIGAGRIVLQESVTISHAISDGTFFKNPAFIQALRHAKAHRSGVHLMGLLSNGQSAHSHPDHLLALIMFFHQHQIWKLYVHLFTDGRDSQRYSALKLLRKYRSAFSSYGTIASVIGRVYAMDRKKDWERTRATYDALVHGRAQYTVSSAEDAIIRAYNRGETDEFISPTVITESGKPVGAMRDNDVIVFFNLRSDRARQLTKAFVQTEFERVNKGAFTRGIALRNICYIAMTDFGPDLENILTAYPSRDIVDSLPMVLRDLRQLYIAESEKYAHITFFFNGGYDYPVAGEERIMIPSPDVLSYVTKPYMALPELENYLFKTLQVKNCDFIAANISNADMIAHTGDLEATITAIERVDAFFGKIVPEVLSQEGVVFITGDHGNAEELFNRDTREIDTEHSQSAVPMIIISAKEKFTLRTHGILADVAPTILDVLHIPKPALMTGASLITSRIEYGSGD